MGRHLLEGKSIIEGTGALLEGVNIPFHFWDMLIICYCVESDPEVGELTTDGFKLSIHEQVYDLEATVVVYLLYLLDSIQQHWGLLAIKFLGCTELDVTGHGDKEGYLVDINHICGQGHPSVLCHDGRWYIGGVYLHQAWLTSDSLPFKRTKVRSKDVLSC